MEKQLKYMTFRPKVSESGARIKGPRPSMITNPVWQPMTLPVLVCKDFAIWSIPGAKMLLANGLRTIKMLATIRAR
jgi:hypothetical protein